MLFLRLLSVTRPVTLSASEGSGGGESVGLWLSARMLPQMLRLRLSMTVLGLRD